MLHILVATSMQKKDQEEEEEEPEEEAEEKKNTQKKGLNSITFHPLLKVENVQRI